MIKIRLIYLIIFLLFFSGCGKEDSYPWIDDDLDVVLNRNSEKMVLLDFETDWWTWCDRLDNDTFSNEKIIDFANDNLISLKIDAEKGLINLNVDKNELEIRNKKLKVKENDFGSGALWKFSQSVGSARYGAVTHPGALKEKKTYSDI